MAPPPSDQSHNSIAHTSESDTSEAIKGRTRWTLEGGGCDYIFLPPTIAQKSYDDMGEREDDVAENEEMMLMLLMMTMLVLMLKPSILKPMYQSFQAGLPCIGLISISPTTPC